MTSADSRANDGEDTPPVGFFIKKTDPDVVTPLDKYITRVYYPFLGTVINLCNQCDFLLGRTLTACNLPKKKITKRTLGQKTDMLEQERTIFEEMISPAALDHLVGHLRKTNKLFNLMKHSHVGPDPKMANDKRLLEPGFDFDSLDLIFGDVFTLEQVVTLTPEERRRGLDGIAATMELLHPLAKKATAS